MKPHPLHRMPFLMKHNYLTNEVADFFHCYLDIVEADQSRTDIMDILDEVYKIETDRNWSTNLIAL